MGSETEPLHIAVFPWLAFGHMLPFLELSKSLAERGHRISYISTPRNIQRLPKPPPNLSSLIHFIPLSLPATQGLPEHAEATTDIPPYAQEFLKKAFDGLQHPLQQFIQQSTPKLDWIIHDFAPYWLPSVADIPTVFLTIYNAASTAFLGPPSELDGKGNNVRKNPEGLTVMPPWITIPSKMRWLPYEARGVVDFFMTPNASGVSDSYRLAVAVESARAVALRTCYEFEAEWLQILERIFKKDVVPVGLIPPPFPSKEAADEGEKAIIEWLDAARKPRSVIYVAFGSEVMLSDELLREIALGLEVSDVAFLWAFRRPVGFGEGSDVLPAGFEERVKGRGLVARGWVPQHKILAHESVGGFLTHSGWSSCIEGVRFGQALAMLPIFGDQRLNSQILEDMGIGFQVERDEEDGSFDREAVAKAVRLVMVGEVGEGCRDKARELGKVFGSEEIQEKYVEGLVKYLNEHREDIGNKSN